MAVRVCYDQPPAPGEDQCPLNAVMDGVDYVSNNAQANDVANMSIWGKVNSQNEASFDALENAIANAAINKGIKFTLIAGNAADHADEYGPGRMSASNVWTLSAYNNNDAFATNFSNYGFPVSDGGPGVNILSLWVGGGTNTLSGTSMAAPHVAGILLATGDNPLPIDGHVTNDPDSFDDKIPVLPSDLNAYILGPSFVSNGHQGTWTAQTSGGDPPFSYVWYRNNHGNTPYWKTVSFSSNYSTTVTQSFELKIEVTDASNTTVITDIKSVATN